MRGLLGKMRNGMVAVGFTLFAMQVGLAVDTATVFTPSAGDLEEPPGIRYSGAPDLLDVRVRTVVEPGVCAPGEYAGCTLEDVNADEDPNDDFKPRIRVHFQADDFPDDGQVSNAELRQRGNTSRLAVQKSYRIKLDSKKRLWRGERRLQLNKHPWDLTRVRNKLSFDLMWEIPHLPSLNTQFVHLFVDGEDYGLYTHVEHVGKEYLKRRGWDKDSNIYKAEDFRFRMTPALALDEGGKPLDEAAFESVLEIKRGKRHDNLIAMLTALEDAGNDFRADVFERYFNRNNYLTWLAVNILMDNKDTAYQNFYLFNPAGSSRFYFLPWDYDGAWGFFEQPDYQAVGYRIPRWKRSVGTWWDSLLHRRFLQQPDGLELLNRAVEEIRRNHLGRDRIEALLDSYHEVVYPFVSRPPDLYYLPSPAGTEAEILQQYEAVYASLAAKVEQNHEDFIRHQEDPMPFWQYEPELEGETLRFWWDRSVDLQGDGVGYDLEIATTPDFSETTLVHRVTGLDVNRYGFRWNLPAGEYYYRVIARDSADPEQHWQIAFNSYRDEVTGREYHGVTPFRVEEDGTEDGTPSIPPEVIIDGDAGEWLASLSVGRDGREPGRNEGADWREGWVAHDADYIYIAYRVWNAIDSGNWWRWKVYFDLDRDPDTGFRSAGAGVEYMLEGDSLWRYSGDGYSWSWEYVGAARSGVSGDFVEMALPRAWLGDPEVLHLVFHGLNPKGGDDRLPDTGYIDYRVTSVEEPTWSNPGAAITVDGDLDDWAGLTSFGPDPDDVPGGGNLLDWLEGWVAHDATNLYFAYRNQGPIDPERWWAWHIYIDIDDDPATGFGRAGAEYMLEDYSLWRYTGDGSSWSWQWVGSGAYATSEGRVEIAVPRMLLEGVERMNLLFEGSNGAFPEGDGTVDRYPGEGSFAYRLGAQ